MTCIPNECSCAVDDVVAGVTTAGMRNGHWLVLVVLLVLVLLLQLVVAVGYSSMLLVTDQGRLAVDIPWCWTCVCCW
jgi:hypothetical protein